MAQVFDPLKCTVKNLYQECRGDEVRAHLVARGISQDFLDNFGNGDSLCPNALERKILDGADLFRQRKINDFSGPLLTMLLYWDTWSPDVSYDYRKRVGHRLRQMFGDEAKLKSRKYGMNVSAVQILREESDNYSGNFYEARGYWRGFIPSEADFARGIRIPVHQPDSDEPHLSVNDAFALGVIYAGGFLSTSGQLKKHPNRMWVYGDKNDNKFFADVVYPLLSVVFNISDINRSEERLTRDRKRTYQMPILRIDSLAIATWLRYDLRFPAHQTRNKNKTFPDILSNQYNCIAFLSGFVSLKGTIHKPRGAIRFVSRDTALLSRTLKLLSDVGIPTSQLYQNGVPPFFEVTRQGVPVLMDVLDIRNQKFP